MMIRVYLFLKGKNILIMCLVVTADKERVRKDYLTRTYNKTIVFHRQSTLNLPKEHQFNNRISKYRLRVDKSSMVLCPNCTLSITVLPRACPKIQIWEANHSLISGTEPFRIQSSLEHSADLMKEFKLCELGRAS